tara:strand:+ start:1922 stop:2125 length:204 start_codon:yes stop_codon:yes gene_type:complete
MPVIDTTFQQLLSSFFNLANPHSGHAKDVPYFLESERSLLSGVDNAVLIATIHVLPIPTLLGVATNV